MSPATLGANGLQGASCCQCCAAPCRPTHNPSHKQLLVRLGVGDVSFLCCHCHCSSPPFPSSLWSSTGPCACQDHCRPISSVIHLASSHSQAWGQVLVPCGLLVLLMLIIFVVPCMTHPMSEAGGQTGVGTGERFDDGQENKGIDHIL